MTSPQTWKVKVPDGKSGDWSVERFTVSEEDSKWDRLRASIKGSGRYVPPGAYTRLLIGSTVVMSDTPDECRDHHAPVKMAERLGGRVLVHGLGLGVVLQQLLLIPDVTHVDVVEKSEDVIRLVAPSYRTDKRVEIHHGDAYLFKWPSSARWSVVWHDIWTYICSNNLQGMARLHRRFGRKAEWQGSWGKNMCQRSRMNVR